MDARKLVEGIRYLLLIMCTIALCMTALLFVSISSMVTKSTEKEPSENIFNNPQTIHVLNQ